METLLQLDHPLRFACGPDLPCFTVCCSDLDLVLTPYDLLRLQRRLGLSSEQFLARYTERQLRGRADLPFLFLRMRDDEKKSCPFLTPQGCAVYSDRPLACRLYPLGLLPPAPEIKSGGEEFKLIQEPDCQGHQQQPEWMVKEWLADQCPGEELDLGRAFSGLCFDPQLRNRPLTLDQRELFYTAAYNFDRLRRLISEDGFFKPYLKDPELAARLLTDDIALIRYGLSWLRSCLLSEAERSANSG